jgi:murein L,D-transpeptidase YcbB/YkuD
MSRRGPSRTCVLGLMIMLPLVLGCAVREAPSADPSADRGELRYVISLSERELYEYVDGERVSRYPVAIGQPGHPTPTGAWTIDQVDWNPDWTPPDSEWAEGRRYKEPGEEGNPMGRVRIIFHRPYTIHGTEALESLGTAASHGSVRISNPDGIEVARRVMEFGGAERSEAWIEETLADPTTMREVAVPDPIPIEIRD